MWSLIFRLAMMGGAILVMWNVASTFLRALRHPKETVALPPESRDAAAAREIVERALKRLTTIEVASASLKDAEIWQATERLVASVRGLSDAVMADPGQYRRARRHLGQLLFGTEHVTKRFSALYSANPDPDAKAEFLTLCDDLIATYDRATAEYAKAGIEDLRLETDVLRQLIERARR